MQTAMSEATIDENDIVHFIEICYCLEGGLYPMVMEIPVLNKYFDEAIEVKDARLRNQCTMECEFCDCTRNIKLPGKSLTNVLNFNSEQKEENSFIDIGRIQSNRQKQNRGLEGLKNSISTIHNNKNSDNNNIKPIFGGAAVSGLFAIFYDGIDYFRIKNIPDIQVSRLILQNIGLEVYKSVCSTRSVARRSLAKSDERSNVV